MGVGIPISRAEGRTRSSKGHVLLITRRDQARQVDSHPRPELASPDQAGAWAAIDEIFPAGSKV